MDYSYLSVSNSAGMVMCAVPVIAGTARVPRNLEVEKTFLLRAKESRNVLRGAIVARKQRIMKRNVRVF